MQLDPATTQTMQRRIGGHATKGAWMRLLSALLRLGGGHAELVSHAERAWASATFSGARHTVRLAFAGTEAVAAGDALIDALPDHEFCLPHHLVADATVIAVEQHLLPAPRMEVDVELLLVDDL